MQAEHERDEDERWLRALSELPRPELTAARQQEITAALRGALAEGKPSLSSRWFALMERYVEPTLVVTCSGLVLVRLAMVLARYFGAV